MQDASPRPVGCSGLAFRELIQPTLTARASWTWTGLVKMKVLLKIYAHCIDGRATAANQRIAKALGIPDAEEDPGDEGDGDAEQAS